MAFLPRGYLSPNSFLYLLCFLTAHTYICATATARNSPAARVDQPLDCFRRFGEDMRKLLTGVVEREPSERRPSHRLEEVVGARHEVETVTARDGASASAGRAQRAEVEVSDAVGELRKL